MNYSSYLSPQAGEKENLAVRSMRPGEEVGDAPFPSSVQALAGTGDAAGAGVWGGSPYFIYSI